MLRTAAPILLAALGGLLCEKAGVLNLALEGMMLFGAFFGVMGSYYTNNAYVGALVAMVTGAVLGMIYTRFVEHWKADAMIPQVESSMATSRSADARDNTFFIFQTLLTYILYCNSTIMLVTKETMLLTRLVNRMPMNMTIAIPTMVASVITMFLPSVSGLGQRITL